MGQKNGKLVPHFDQGGHLVVAAADSPLRSQSAGVLRRPMKSQGAPAQRKGSAIPVEAHEATLYLTNEQKYLIRESFEAIKQTVADVGVVFFMRLFETHPEVQDVFLPFNGLSQEDLFASTQLRNHGLRVMGFVEKCVARMDQPEKLVALCLELGTRHAKYGVPLPYLALIPPQFIYAIKPVINERWTADTETAWLTLFSIALYYMGKAMRNAAAKEAPTTSNTTATRKASI